MTVSRGLQTAVTRRAALASLAMLLASQVLDCWVHQPPLTIWVVSIVPLLIFVPGLIRDKPRTYIWLCFVILLYFTVLVLRLFVDPADPVAWVGMVSVTVLFVAAMLYARWRSRELRTESDGGES